MHNWEEFWARYGKDTTDGSRVECSWTQLKGNIKRYRDKLDEDDMARARLEFVGEAFTTNFSSIKSGRSTVIKSRQEIAHRYRLLKQKPNIWDDTF